MATEVAFAKSFLTLIDSKPTKITADHVEDARNYPATIPYTLPRLPSQRPLPKSTNAKSTAPGSEPSVTVTIRSLRNPPLSVQLASLPLTTTSALDIKNAVAAEADIAVSKLKLLWNKKPVVDSKTLRDIIGDENTGAKEVEFSVIVMGGAAAVGTGPKSGSSSGSGPSDKKESVVAQGLSGEGVLETDSFWSDLKGFLQQRIRDEKVAGEVAERFEAAWKGRS